MKTINASFQVPAEIPVSLLIAAARHSGFQAIKIGDAPTVQIHGADDGFEGVLFVEFEPQAVAAPVKRLKKLTRKALKQAKVRNRMARAVMWV